MFPPKINIFDILSSITMATGTSPYEVNTPTPGRYSFLILGEYEGLRASLLLWYEVHPPSGQLEVSIIQRSISSNGSVLVEFGASGQGVEFQCSTGNVSFFQCELSS